MKRVKHFLLASCLLPAFLGAQGVAKRLFSGDYSGCPIGRYGRHRISYTDNGSTAIFHNASTIAFSQDVMGPATHTLT